MGKVESSQGLAKHVKVQMYDNRYRYDEGTWNVSTV